MSYSAMAVMTQDQSLINRIAACAAAEQVAPYPDHPLAWANNRVWRIIAQPEWAAKYAAAVEARALQPALPADGAGAGEGRAEILPGSDEAVITDEMILAAVTAIHDEDMSAST